MELSACELALHLCRSAREKAGEDLRLLEMPAGFALFDYAVIVNGRSDRQVFTLVNEAYHFCKRHGISHRGIEGEAGWRVIDCGDVVFHAFLPATRGYYALDEVWTEAQEVDVEAGLAELAKLDKG